MTKREARYGFSSLLVDRRVLAYLGSESTPKVIAACLRTAFERIRQKRLRMVRTERSGEFMTYACDHAIAASVTSDGRTVVILRVRYGPEPEGLL